MWTVVAVPAATAPVALLKVANTNRIPAGFTLVCDIRPSTALLKRFLVIFAPQARQQSQSLPSTSPSVSSLPVRSMLRDVVRRRAGSLQREKKGCPVVALTNPLEIQSLLKGFSLPGGGMHPAAVSLHPAGLWSAGGGDVLMRKGGRVSVEVMASIVTARVEEMDLTVHTVEGRVTAAEVIDKIREFYHGGSITTNTMWDFTAADASRVESREIREIAVVVSRYGHKRKGGRTALVLPGDLEFGLGRMFSSFTEMEMEMEDNPFEFRCFRNRAEAESWLRG